MPDTTAGRAVALLVAALVLAVVVIVVSNTVATPQTYVFDTAREQILRSP